MLKRFLSEIGAYFLLLSKTLIRPQKASIFGKLFMREVYDLGVNSFGLVLFTSTFVGAVVAIQMFNNFKTFKFRIIPPTLLKSFFTNNGSADKLEMIESFINNYDGKKLIPQIDLSNKYVSELNDIIDSFALVAFNVYDLKMEEKFLFNIKKIKTKSKKKRKIKPKVNKVNLDKNLPDTNEFENNINSKILKQYEII